MELRLRIKPYIKPFERELAFMELKQLACVDEIKEDKGVYCIDVPDTQSCMDTLINRLAYWESVGDKELKPTLQVMLESTYNQMNNGIDVDLTGYPIFTMPQTRILRYGTHDLHEYRGKFFPQLVKSFINIANLKAGDTVIDPFCGSGTTNCEARAMGMKTIGIDLNPLSVKISKVKTEVLELKPDQIVNEFNRIRSSLTDKNNLSLNTHIIWNEKDYEYLRGWFALEALNDISYIIGEIRRGEDPRLRDFFEVCLSNIIRSVSWQKESDLRVRKEIKEYIPQKAIELFLDECIKQINRIIPYLSLINGKTVLQPFDIREGNTTEIDTIFADRVGNCDLIITSPPYATALPYLDTDRLSLVILGLMSRKDFSQRDFKMIGNREVTEKQRKELWDIYLQRKKELPDEIVNLIDMLGEANHNGSVGFRRRNLPALLSKYFLDMLDAMKSALRMIKSGGYAFYVVGNNSTNIGDEKVEIPTDKFLWDLGEEAGWIKENFIEMDLVHSRDIFKKNKGTAESILVFRKG